MILFYKKESGEIFGVIQGRVHDDNTLKKGMIKPASLDESEIGKYVVPYKQKFRRVTEPVTEMRVVDEETKRVEEVKVGEKKVKKSAGMEPAVEFKELIYDFERGRKSPHDYKIKLEDGEVKGFEKRQ